MNADALANWRVSIDSLQARLRDGTFVRFPDDALLSPVEIPRSAFRSAQDRLMVHLAVPRLQLGRRNAETQSGDATSRYSIDSQEVEDETRSAIRWW